MTEEAEGLENFTMMGLTEWDIDWLHEAERRSRRSKDRTKIGAVLVRWNKTRASDGYNGLPRKMNDAHLADRKFKNFCVLHAEENAILHCEDTSMEGYTMYVYGLPPCAHCMSVMAQVGVARVVAVNCNTSPDWNESCEAAKVVALETDIQTHYISKEYYDTLPYDRKDP